jgi:hypothetical protein
MELILSSKLRSGQKGAIIVLMHLVFVVALQEQVILQKEELSLLNIINVLAVVHAWLHALTMPDILILQVMSINALFAFTG